MALEFIDMITGKTVTALPWQEALSVGDHYLIIGTDGLRIVGEILEATEDAGMFWVKAYSVICPEGEEGLFCVCDAYLPISAQIFEALRAAFQNGTE